MFQFKTQPQQDSLFQNAGFHAGMPDRAEQDRREFTEVVRCAVGEDFVGPQIAIPAEVEMSVIEFEPEFRGCDIKHLDGFTCDFGAGSVPANDCDIVVFHAI